MIFLTFTAYSAASVTLFFIVFSAAHFNVHCPMNANKHSPLNKCMPNRNGGDFQILNSRFSNTRGFALVIALSLMAFILLLVLSLATFVRVESSLAKTQLQRLLAQQNAILGAHIAIGELQRLTGPDRRGTAPARILASDDADFATPGNRFWTAVWDAESKDLLGYLTAGGSRPLDPDFVSPFSFAASMHDGIPINSNHIMLVGANEATVDGAVLAPRLIVEGSGSFSWWVGDLSARSLLRSPRPNSIHNAPDYLHASRSAVEAVFPGALDANRFDQLSSGNQLPFIGNPASIDDLKQHFHDLTIYSLGLQLNARDGGLRGNLNAAFEGDMQALYDFHADAGGRQIFAPQRPGSDDIGGPFWTQLQSFYNSPDSLTGSGSAAAIAPRLTTDASGGIYPIPMHIQYWVHASLASVGSNEVRTRLHVLPRIALWNPYNVSLSASTYYFSFREPNYPLDSWNNNINVHLAYNLPGNSVRSVTHNESVPFQFNQPIRLSVPVIGPGEVVLLTPSENASASDVVLTSGDRDHYYFLDHPNVFTLPDDAENIEMRINPFETFNPPGTPGNVGNHTWMVLSMGPSSASVSARLRSPVAQRLDALYHSIRFIPVFGFNGLVVADPEQTTYLANTPYPSSTFPELTDLFAFNQWPSVGFYVSKRQPENTFQNENYRRLAWLAHYNPRGRLSGRAPQDHARSPVTGGANTTVNSVPGYTWATSVDKDFYDTEFRQSLRVGYSDRLGPARSVLFEIPRRKSDIRSLGQFTHAHLSLPAGNVLLPAVNPSRLPGETGPMLNEVNRPAYPIGNSLADPHLGEQAESDLVQLSRVYRDSWPNVHQPMPPQSTAYDWSYLLNQALFDRYFVSTASSDWFTDVLSTWSAGDPLPSLPQDRYLLQVPDGFPEPTTPLEWREILNDFEKSAAFVPIDGAFNINSTSVFAWEAELAGLMGSGDSLSGLSPDEIPFVRSSYPVEAGFSGGANTSPEAHAGYRKLSKTEVRRLAEALVDEIRERGPFTSIADFINRNPAADEVTHRLRGALANAIDRAGINDDLNTPFSSRSDYETAPQANHSYRDFATLALEGPRLQGAPGFMSSADIVARIGANWTVRGDTFIIRAYGGGGDVIGGTGNTRAVCEVIVQRSISATQNGSGGYSFAPMDGFGYRYKVISFRWIDINEM